MATKLHSAVAGGSRHPIHQLTYPDAANRIAGTNEGTGATPKDFDVAKQDDDDSLWLLTAAVGPTWYQIGGATLSITDLTLSGNLGVGGDITLVGSMAIEEETFIPISWGCDGTAPPEGIAIITSGTGSVQVRKFDDASVEDVVIPWQVPQDIVAADGITFQVIGIITEAAAPAATEGVSFKMSGFSLGVGDALNGAFGAEVESANVDLNAAGCAAQYDIFYTVESTKVTVTDLAAGEMAQLHFERDTADADDDYAQDVGIIGIIIRYNRAAVGA